MARRASQDGLAGFRGDFAQGQEDIPLPGPAAGGRRAPGARPLRPLPEQEEAEEAQGDRAGPDGGVAPHNLAQGAGRHGQLAGGLGLGPAGGPQQAAELPLGVRLAAGSRLFLEVAGGKKSFFR